MNNRAICATFWRETNVIFSLNLTIAPFACQNGANGAEKLRDISYPAKYPPKWRDKSIFNSISKLISPNTRQSGEIEQLNQNETNEELNKVISEGIKSVYLTIIEYLIKKGNLNKKVESS